MEHGLTAAPPVGQVGAAVDKNKDFLSILVIGGDYSLDILDFLTISGEQHQPVRCFEMDVGVVDESLCDPDRRPEDRHRKCKTIDCPARF